MLEWAEHVLVGAVLAAAGGFVVWQAARTLRGKKSVVGSCCNRGCEADDSAKRRGERVVFLPAELLGRKKK